MRKNTCLVRKKSCQSNQIVRCLMCKLLAHRNCAKIGFNFGVHNYTCSVCHQKKGRLQKSPPSGNESIEYQNAIPDIRDSNATSAKTNRQNDIGTLPGDFDLDALNARISSANQKNIVIGPSETADLYLSLDNLNAVLRKKSANDIFVIHYNAVSWVKNFDSLISLFDRMTHQPDIICVSETRLKDSKINWQINLIDIENYDLKYDNSPSDAGGVAVYIKKGIFKSTVVKKNLRLNVPECESIFLEIRIATKTNLARKDSKLLLGCTYRHPRTSLSSISDFSDKLRETLELYTIQNIPVVILGDMNIDTSDHNDSGVIHYTNMLSSIGCENLTNIPTCFSETTRSTLDHVVTSIDRESIKNGVLDITVTDHLPTFALITDQNRNTQKKHDQNNDMTWQFINDTKKDMFLTSFHEKLENINLSNDPEQILASLTEATIATVDLCFPPKQLSNKAKKRSLTPWFGSEIYEGDKKQSRLFRRFIKSKKPEDHQAYKEFRKKLSKQKYRAKRAYFRKLLRESDITEDRSATWDVINKAFGKKRKSRIYPKKGHTGESSNQVDKENAKDVANKLNQHFASVAEKLAANLKKTRTKFTAYMGRENRSSMYLKEITINEIFEEILKICIKKSMGYDNIPPKIIKWASDLLAPLLLY